MDLDTFLDIMDDEEQPVDEVLDDLVREVVARQAGWINECGRGTQIKYLIKEEAAYNEKELIQEIEERLKNG